MQATIFIEVFSKLSDSRVKRTKKHSLLDILGLALFAVLAGAQAYTEIEDFCRHHRAWLKSYFLLPNGIPSHDTFARVFAMIDSEAFQACFFEWVKKLIDFFPENVIPIDGKAMRATRDTRKKFKALHVVSAWSCANGLSLGQIKVDEKSNEIVAVPELLKKLCIEGAIITLDAMGCQRALAEQIVDAKADYIFRVKANQEGLLEALKSTFTTAEQKNYQEIMHFTAEDQVNNDHGRIEQRTCIVLPMMYCAMMRKKWKGLKSLVLIISQRETLEEKTTELRYYISSLDPKNPERILTAIRAHWQIENNCHWLLDVAYREDQSRIRDKNAAMNMAWLRKTALALLKRADHIKGGMRRKQLTLWAKPEEALKMLKI